MIHKFITICFATGVLILSIQHVDAHHLWGKSQEFLDKALRHRIDTMPYEFDRLILDPASRKRPLPDSKSFSRKNELTDVNSEIDKEISSTSLFSVLYFDGEKVLIDRKSEKISDLSIIFSHSMAKQLVGYLLGHALCEGKIDSVEDTVQKYLKVTSGTPWGNKTLRQMINMQAGSYFVKANKTLRETAKKVKYLKSLKLRQ